MVDVLNLLVTAKFSCDIHGTLLLQIIGPYTRTLFQTADRRGGRVRMVDDNAGLDL